MLFFDGIECSALDCARRLCVLVNNSGGALCVLGCTWSVGHLWDQPDLTIASTHCTQICGVSKKPHACVVTGLEIFVALIFDKFPNFCLFDTKAPHLFFFPAPVINCTVYFCCFWFDAESCCLGLTSHVIKYRLKCCLSVLPKRRAHMMSVEDLHEQSMSNFFYLWPFFGHWSSFTK